MGTGAGGVTYWVPRAVHGGACTAACLGWVLRVPEFLSPELGKKKKPLEILKKWEKGILFKHFNMILILVSSTKVGMNIKRL